MPDYLVTPAQLPRYHVPSAFLSRFVLRSFELQIGTGGQLGTMAFTWRLRGEENWSNTPILSSAGATWACALEDVFADLVFTDSAYVADTIYVVDEGGTVTTEVNGTMLSVAVIAVSRYDLRETACSSVTSEALTLMRNAVQQPLLQWGDDVRTHAAAMVYALLKRSRGATANGAGVGDENIFLAEDAARAFFRGIGEGGKPDSIVDSSPTEDGPMFASYPVSDTPRGW